MSSWSAALVAKYDAQPLATFQTPVDQDRDLILNQLLSQVPRTFPAEQVILRVADAEAEGEGWWQRMMEWQEAKSLRHVLSRHFGEEADLEPVEWAQAVARQALQTSGRSKAAVLVCPWTSSVGHSLWQPSTAGEVSQVWEWAAEHNPELWLESLCRFLGYDGLRGAFAFLSLASLGESRFVDALRAFVDEWQEDGRVALEQDYLVDAKGEKPDWSLWQQLFGGEPREPSAPVTARELDMARSMDLVLRQMILHMGRKIRENQHVKEIVLVGSTLFSRMLERVWLEEKVFDQVLVVREDLVSLAAQGSVLSSFVPQVPTPSIPKALHV